jgi:hypothetical protein
MANPIADFDAIRISLASPEKIRSWSHGEVTKPETKFSVSGSQFSVKPARTFALLAAPRAMPQWLIFQRSLGEFRPQLPPQDEQLRTGN